MLTKQFLHMKNEQRTFLVVLKFSQDNSIIFLLNKVSFFDSSSFNLGLFAIILLQTPYFAPQRYPFTKLRTSCSSDIPSNSFFRWCLMKGHEDDFKGPWFLLFFLDFFFLGCSSSDSSRRTDIFSTIGGAG